MKLGIVLGDSRENPAMKLGVFVGDSRENPAIVCLTITPSLRTSNYG